MTSWTDPIWDMGAFHSRLIVRGTLELRTGLRIGAGRDTQVEAVADLPVVKDINDIPYIPGSSFKGTWRAATEALLRGRYTDAQNVACLSVPRDEITLIPSVCLTQATVTRLKSLASGKVWTELLQERPEYLPNQTLDENLRRLSCWTCRIFGAPWLAGKVYVKDMPMAPEQVDVVQPDMRDGVAIDRNTGRAAYKKKYAYEIVPSVACFDVEIIIENATSAELGLIWLGLQAFRQGWIPLGGARSRGQGACTLEINWHSSQWLTRANFVAALFPDADEAVVGNLAQEGETQVAHWHTTFLNTLSPEGGHHA